jgi:hypothetical protein
MQREANDIVDLCDESVGAWEPTYDTELWRNKRKIALFVHATLQKYGDVLADTSPTSVKVLEWCDKSAKK